MLALTYSQLMKRQVHTIPLSLLAAPWSCPQSKGCEEKAGLSLIFESVLDSIG